MNTSFFVQEHVINALLYNRYFFPVNRCIADGGRDKFVSRNAAFFVSHTHRRSNICRKQNHMKPVAA